MPLPGEAIDRIAYYASLAPSPHNVQGWRFRAGGEAIEVRRDPARAVLHELDPEGKEGLVGFGAAVENLCVAARREGFEPEVWWLPDPSDPDLLARVALAPGGPGDDPLFPALTLRTVNRSPYRPEPVAEEVISALQAAAAACGFTLHVATERERIERLARLAGLAGRLKLSHGPTHRELYRWLRFSPEEPARSRDGLPMEHFFVPRPLAAAARYIMRWGVTRLLNWVGYARALARANEAALVRSAPAVCLLAAADGERETYLRGGRAFERIALTAALRGLSLQPHSGITELGFARRAGYHESIPRRWRKKIDRFPEALREVFGHEGDPHVIALFRLGVPTREPASRSPRRPLDDVLERAGAPAEADAFHAELVRRNAPALDAEDQARLRRARLLLAGCGSIGGAPVELLARMGAERLLLAEPGAYELNNLNRQMAGVADIGRNKGEALRDRVLGINPHAQVLVATDGVMEGNAQYLIGSSEVAIDGIDVTEPAALRVKRLLHEEARRQRRPVVSGYDIGGTQLVRVYDYRRPSLRPFAGRLDGIADDALTPVLFLSRVIAPLDFPAEMLPVVEARIRGSTAPLPQLGPTAALFGVLAAWAVLDLLASRPVRAKVRVDIPGLIRPRGAALRARALAHPLYRGQYVSADGRSTAILLKTEIIEYDALYRQRLVRDVRALAKGERYRDLRASVVGTPVLDADLDRITGREAGLFFALSSALIFGILAVVLRTWRGVVFPLVVVALSIVWRIGIMGWSGATVSIFSAIIPSLLVTVGVADSVHVVHEFYVALDRLKDRGAAARETFELTAWSCLMTTLTTAGGFISLYVSDLQPIRELATYSATGCLLHFVLAMGLLPALLSYGGLEGTAAARIAAGEAEEPRGFAAAVARATLALTGRHRRAIIIGASALAVVSATGAARMRPENFTLGYFKATTEIRRDFDRVDRTMAGTTSLEVVVDTGREEGALDPAVLRAVEGLQRAIEAGHPDLVMKTYPVADILKEERQALHEGKAEAYALPARADEAAQLIFLFEMSGSKELSDRLSFDRAAARVHVRLRSVPASRYLGLHEEVERLGRERFPEGVKVTTTGLMKLLTQTLEYITAGQVQSFALALGVVSLVMAISFGSIRLGLICLIPNVLPILVVLGIIGFCGYPLDIVTMLVDCIAIGIAVDDTVHFLLRYRHERELGHARDEAMRRTIYGTGEAVISSSVVLGLGFLVYAFSQLENLALFGLFSAATIAIALLTELLLTPICLLALKDVGERRRAG